MRSQGLSEILVPLDGSEAADRAIPVAARIAVRSGARLHLVAIRRSQVPVTGQIAPDFAVVTPGLESINHAVFANHLEAHADDIEMLYHVPVAREVINGVESVADELVTYAARHEIDLIVMRTHGRSAIGESLAYLVDVPLTAKGKAPKLKKQRFLVFAKAVPGRPGELVLVDRRAQIPATPESEQRARGVIAALAAPDAPPRVSGIREVMSVAGNLAGESETQLFLDTETGEPV